MTIRYTPTENAALVWQIFTYGITRLANEPIEAVINGPERRKHERQAPRDC